MKKTAKILLCLSAFAFLAGCAKTVNAEEAANIAVGLKFENLNIKEGKTKITYHEISGTGEKSKALVALMALGGASAGSTDETTIKKELYSSYFVSAVEIRAWGDTNMKYTADGTAITIEATNKIGYDSTSTTKVATDSTFRREYRKDGLLSFQKYKLITTFSSDDVLVVDATTNYTWTLA